MKESRKMCCWLSEHIEEKWQKRKQYMRKRQIKEERTIVNGKKGKKSTGIKRRRWNRGNGE